MPIELFNSEGTTIMTYPSYDITKIKLFVKSNKKLVFILRGFNNDKYRFLLYVSCSFANVCNRMLKEMENDSINGIINKYTITLEEGY